MRNLAPPASKFCSGLPIRWRKHLLGSRLHSMRNATLQSVRCAWNLSQSGQCSIIGGRSTATTDLRTAPPARPSSEPTSSDHAALEPLALWRVHVNFHASLAPEFLRNGLVTVLKSLQLSMVTQRTHQHSRQNYRKRRCLLERWSNLLRRRPRSLRGTKHLMH
eukprot:COSAG02_NODE_2062_length_9971_cov_5.016106_2_plen_163_part_00